MKTVAIQPQNLDPSPFCRCSRSVQAMTLVEMVIAVGLGMLVLTTVMLLYIFGMRSFTAIGNYTDMDIQSRRAMDLMLRDMRQATGVVSWNTNLPTRSLLLANSVQNKAMSYVWDSASGAFYCTTTTTNGGTTTTTTITNLTGCDNWQFTPFQRTPNANWIFNVDWTYGDVKMIDMNWNCSRTNLYKKFNTESMVTAQVVLRNKP